MPAGAIEAPRSIFLSYHRSSAEVRRWVTRVFEPLLRERLELDAAIVGTETVFRDERSIEDGAHWPEELKLALQHSRVIIVVGSPAYFTRRWCRAELETMRGRHERTGGPCILPIRFSDGDFYPSEVRELQWRDLTSFAYVRSHRNAPKALVHQMKEICCELRRRLERMPDDPNWTFVDPGPLRPPQIGRPSLGRSTS